MQGRPRTSVLALAAGALVGAVGLSVPSTVGAATTFEAVAAADGIRIGMRVPNAPVTDQPVDSGGPTAQAILNSAGVSRAFASHPYPGEAVVTGPGTVAGFTGGQVSPPVYPFVVASDHPTIPEQSNQQGPYTLTASSGERRSQSEASVGADSGPHVTSQAVVELDDGGGATSLATSDVSSLAVGELRLGRILSTARVMRAADGTLTRSSDLQVTGFSVAGTAVGLGPAGLTLPGGSVPLPPADPVRQALEASGITITYLTAQSQPTGVVAPGVAISAPVQMPDGGTATVTYSIGQSAASIAGVPVSSGDVEAAPVVDEVTAPAAPALSSAPPSSVPPPPGTENAALGPSAPITPTGGGSAGTADVSPSPATTDAAAAGPEGATVPPDPGAVLGAAPVVEARGFDSASIFLVLAGAGLVAFGLVSLFSALGVRSR